MIIRTCHRHTKLYNFVDLYKFSHRLELYPFNCSLLLEDHLEQNMSVFQPFAKPFNHLARGNLNALLARVAPQARRSFLSGR